MIDPPTVPRDVDIIAIGFGSAVAILLLGLLLSVPFAGAQTVPFDGRIDELSGDSTGPGAPTFGLSGGYQSMTYARLDWIPTSTGIFCGIETQITQEINVDVTLEGGGVSLSWQDQVADGVSLDLYLWPEECFTYTSGTTYSFTFANSDAVSNVGYLYYGNGTSTNYQFWQYKESVGWYQLFGKYPEWAVIGTSNSSSTEWYQTNVEVTLPEDTSVTEWWSGWQELGTKAFSTKAPFGYVSSVIAIWEDLDTGTSSDYTLNINGQEVAFFDATATEAAIGSGNWTMVRAFMETLLWFSLLTYWLVRVNAIQI